MGWGGTDVQGPDVWVLWSSPPTPWQRRSSRAGARCAAASRSVLMCQMIPLAQRAHLYLPGEAAPPGAGSVDKAASLGGEGKRSPPPLLGLLRAPLLPDFVSSRAWGAAACSVLLLPLSGEGILLLFASSPPPCCNRSSSTCLSFGNL